MVEEGGPEPEAVLGAAGLHVATVHDDLGAGRLAGVDEAGDPVAVGSGHQRTHVGLPGRLPTGAGRLGGARATVADQQRAGALGDAGDEVVGHRLDGDEHADRHAALAGGAVAGVDRGVGGEVEVGVGQDDHVVLGTAQGLHALAVAAGLLVDVLRDRGGPDEADGGHVRRLQQRVDGDLVALEDVEDTVGQAGLLPQLGQPEGRRRVLLARLEHHRVAGRDGDREEPHRHHRREVEGADDAHHAERRALGVHVDAGRRAVAVPALEQVGDAAGELHDLLAAGDLAERVGVHLAVLGGDQVGELALAAVEQLAEGEEHLRAGGQRGLPPRLGGTRRGGDDGGGVRLVGQRDPAGDLAGGGVGDVGPPVGGAVEATAVRPVRDRGGHAGAPWLVWADCSILAALPAHGARRSVGSPR